ncbi:MAG: N,N-dimethylformamidase beta subunit family domain-containing protein, partial [Acidobacteriota bacterium]
MNSKFSATCLLLGGLFCAGTAPALAATPIQIENAKPGTTEWRLRNRGGASSVIEGYASLTSVNRGGQIALFINTAEAAYTMDIFRIGYYGGAGGRRMLATIARTGVAQPPCPTDSATGLIECRWTNPYLLSIPNSPDPTDWMSGIYLVKLTAATSGKQQYISFTVRDDSRVSDVILMMPVNTYQAYNVWGGKSLYGTIASRGDTANAAHKVSFDRPYYGEGSDGAEFFDFQLGPLQWLEREGYDVSYATNVDVDADPTLLRNHKAFLSVGHDEYWTWRMRDHVERARDAGVSLGFFSGNSSYWQVRYEPGGAAGLSARTLVGYKEAWQQDPITPDYLKTNEFRYPPVNRPEDAMMGVRFVTQAKPVMVIEDASHWVFSGTGLRNGDRLANPDGTPFLGYEVDAMGPASPAGVQRLAHSPATAKAATFSDMTVYRAASGATVFAT